MPSSPEGVKESPSDTADWGEGLIRCAGRPQEWSDTHSAPCHLRRDGTRGGWSSSFRNFPRGWPWSWNNAARKISGISRASGLPRPYFQNADPGRHAPCQSRAATTSPSQLSTSPPATTSKTNPTAPPQCPSRAVASRQRSRNAGGMRRLAAEIPDIFIPLSRNDVRNDDDIFDSDVFPAGDSFTGSGVVMRRRAVSGETARGGFGLEDSFTGSPASSACLRNRPQDKRQPPPHRHSGISAARRACLPTGVSGEFFHTLCCGFGHP